MRKLSMAITAAKAVPARRERRGTVDRQSRARRASAFIVLLLCTACIVQFACTAARAQCTARDVLQNQMKFKPHATKVPSPLIRFDRDVATWKTITIGTFADSLGLRDKLDGMGCGVGGQAAEILARPSFILGSRKTSVELALVSPAQLGFESDTVTLADVYARARQFGLELAAAEVGPQLRIQYLDQPVGEFLIIAMEPVKTWSGDPIILNVANGGAGLILIGQDGRAEAEIHVASRLIFARSHQAAAGPELVDQAAVSAIVKRNR